MIDFRNFPAKVRHIILLIALLLANMATAQQRFFGNVNVPANAQVTIFGLHDFNGTGNASGTIKTSRTANRGIVNFAASASFLNAGPYGHVDGYVRQLGNQPFIFPVGNTGVYNPFGAAADGTLGAYFHKSPDIASFPTNKKSNNLGPISETGYWDIKGTKPTKITLTWNSVTDLSGLTSSVYNVVIVGWKDGRWISINSRYDELSLLGGASNLNSGTITTFDAIVPDSYSAYGLAVLVGSLPVQLAEFNAREEGSRALLSWKTTSEIDFDHFEIERSQDGKYWDTIGYVNASGSKNAQHDYDFVDSLPVPGENLYRLKMVDHDLSFAYSKVRSLHFDQVAQAIVYPNPASDLLHVSGIPALRDLSQVRVIGLDNTDYTASVQLTNEAIDVKRLASGTYILQLHDTTGKRSNFRFVIQK